MTPEAQGASVGLSDISSDDLLQLASQLTSGSLRAPLNTASLGLSGFAHLASALEPFFELGSTTLLAILQVALAERRKVPTQSLDLVWSGSDSGPSYARYTRTVIPEMIAAAQRQITIAGYSFDHGAGIFEGLNKAQHERGVSVRLFLDIHQLFERLTQQLRQERRTSRLKPAEEARKESPEAFAAEVLRIFLEVHWPYDTAPPALYYDPRTAEARSFASLHAKCLIVDFEQVLVTSANFTARGQDRNIEVGMLVRDKPYAEALERQWNNLIESGDVVRWG